MSTHHALDYVELTATDLAASRAFYEQAFGWRFTEYGPDYLGYDDGRGREVGGIARAEAGGPADGGGRPARPLVLLYSEDLDATVRAVEAAGGSVTQGPYPFPGGRRFHFIDPGGVELGAWSGS